MLQASDTYGAVAVLSAMITPAVLISACGSLAISTSNRLGRAIERSRVLSAEFEALATNESEDVALRRAMLYTQLRHATRRSELIQRAMVRIYVAIGVFVATSIAIGIVAVTGAGYAWIPVALGLAGGGLLFHASILLVVESRIQLNAVRSEMKFTWQAGQEIAPAELADLHQRRGLRAWWGRRT